MHLEIGSRAYRFRLIDGPLTAGEKRCASVCDHGRREILVSSSVPPEVRLEVAAQAVTEAWKHEVMQRPPMRFVGDVS
jgi:hypothetical protein